MRCIHILTSFSGKNTANGEFDKFKQDPRNRLSEGVGSDVDSSSSGSEVKDAELDRTGRKGPDEERHSGPLGDRNTNDGGQVGEAKEVRSLSLPKHRK